MRFNAKHCFFGPRKVFRFAGETPFGMAGVCRHRGSNSLPTLVSEWARTPISAEKKDGTPVLAELVGVAYFEQDMGSDCRFLRTPLRCDAVSRGGGITPLAMRRGIRGTTSIHPVKCEAFAFFCRYLNLSNESLDKA